MSGESSRYRRTTTLRTFFPFIQRPSKLVVEPGFANNALTCLDWRPASFTVADSLTQLGILLEKDGALGVVELDVWASVKIEGFQGISDSESGDA